MEGFIGSMSLASSESDVSVGKRPLTDTLHALVASPAMLIAVTTYVPASFGKASDITTVALLFSSHCS